MQDNLHHKKLERRHSIKPPVLLSIGKGEVGAAATSAALPLALSGSRGLIFPELEAVAGGKVERFAGDGKAEILRP